MKKFRSLVIFLLIVFVLSVALVVPALNRYVIIAKLEQELPTLLKNKNIPAEVNIEGGLFQSQANITLFPNQPHSQKLSATIHQIPFITAGSNLIRADIRSENGKINAQARVAFTSLATLEGMYADNAVKPLKFSLSSPTHGEKLIRFSLQGESLKIGRVYEMKRFSLSGSWMNKGIFDFDARWQNAQSTPEDIHLKGNIKPLDQSLIEALSKNFPPKNNAQLMLLLTPLINDHLSADIAFSSKSNGKTLIELNAQLQENIQSGEKMINDFFLTGVWSLLEGSRLQINMQTPSYYQSLLSLLDPNLHFSEADYPIKRQFVVKDGRLEDVK